LQAGRHGAGHRPLKLQASNVRMDLIRPRPDATTEHRFAYAFLRMLTGVDFFLHGFTRIFLGSHLSGFAHGMVGNMASAPLPAGAVLAMGYAIPVVELIVGSLLLLTVFVREALLLAAALMIVLMFGVALKQDWNIASQQLVYGMVIAALMFGRQRYDLTWAQFFGRR
jgi:thiosulfate dehydrogenase [quinone] large subunit